jgi:hypothetical protein
MTVAIKRIIAMACRLFLPLFYKIGALAGNAELSPPAFPIIFRP